MKAHLLLFGLLLVSCRVYRQALPTACAEQPRQNAPYAQADTLVALFEELLATGVPGIAAAVYSDAGWWEYAGGYAQLETRTPLRSCHLHYLQSIAKTYQAVAILRLYEEGRLDLDAPITTYLPPAYAELVTRADEITVRMLLRHTSGIPEYNTHPVNITQLLQTPEKELTTPEYLAVIAGQPLDFEPDSRYSYRNSNYELLSLIADAITGDHARHLAEVIFEPLGLTDTYYRNDPGYPNYPRLYNCYWDRHSDGLLENVSQMQRTNVASMIGDDGIVSTPRDAVRFLRGLLEGRLLRTETLDQMYQGFLPDDGSVEYGLGLDHAVLAGHPAYGHSGGGLGAGCQLYYFPHNDTYFFIGINMGTVTEGPIGDAAAPIVEQIQAVLAR